MLKSLNAVAIGGLRAEAGAAQGARISISPFLWQTPRVFYHRHTTLSPSGDKSLGRLLGDGDEEGILGLLPLLGFYSAFVVNRTLRHTQPRLRCAVLPLFKVTNLRSQPSVHGMESQGRTSV